jgi:hypothetical protein
MNLVRLFSSPVLWLTFVFLRYLSPGTFHLLDISPHGYTSFHAVDILRMIFCPMNTLFCLMDIFSCLINICLLNISPSTVDILLLAHFIL